MSTSVPSAWTASIMPLLTDSPSTWTVHAPHEDVSQPMLVPVSLSCSRRNCTSVVHGLDIAASGGTVDSE